MKELKDILQGNADEQTIVRLLVELGYWEDVADESIEYKTYSLIFNINQELNEWLEEYDGRVNSEN